MVDRVIMGSEIDQYGRLSSQYSVGRRSEWKEGLFLIDNFNGLDEEKKNRIINAALGEFAQRGYQKASTNEIVRQAGIAKGMLFYYFGSKKQLYFFLYDFCSTTLETEIVNYVNNEEQDFFTLMRQTSLAKVELLNRYPAMFSFILSVFKEDNSEIKEELNSLNKSTLLSRIEKITSGFDMSKFKEGLDMEKISNIVYWTFEGFSREYQEAMLTGKVDTGSVLKDLDDYLELLKNMFYK